MSGIALKTGKWAHITREMIQELYDQGLTTDEMAARLGMPRGTLAWMLTAYKMTEAHTGRRKPMRYKPTPPSPRPKKEQKPAEPMRVEITPKQEATIRALHGKVPRSQIAKQLGLNKFLLNQMITQMGLR